jgi:hypothetical protein
VRPIAAAKSGATETTFTFGDSSTGWVSIESVTIKRSIGLRLEGVPSIPPRRRRA